MAFNFPNTPNNGDTFTAPTGLGYIWNGYAWLMTPDEGGGGGGGASITIADTPPPGAEPGAMWYESDSGNTYLWYDDGDSQQWVQQNIQPAGPGPTAVATTITSDTPPASPVNGTLWFESDTGALFCYYADPNTSQWIQVSGGVAGPSLPPNDGNEYVMVNGVWRLSRQGFDLTGLATLAIPVPAWMPETLRMTTWVFVSTSANQQAHVSMDGTTFLTGASDYALAGYIHNSNTNAFSNSGWAAFPTILLGPACDNANVPQTSELILKLNRRHSGENIGWSSRGTVLSTTVIPQQSIWHGHAGNNLPVGSGIKAVRWGTSVGTATSGRITVEWLP